MSSNSNITTTLSVQSQLVAEYLCFTLGFAILIGGTVGNCLNILVFVTFAHYKNNACSLYMLAGSVFDLLFLLLGLNTRIVSQGFNIDLTLISRVWCKLRSSLLDILSLCSFTCLCLQSMDVFFYTSRSASMRQRSNIKTARYLLIGLVVLWTVHEIPSLIFQDLILVNGTLTCLYTSEIYLLYHTYISTVVLSICVPTTMIGFFAFRIYQHLGSLPVGAQRILPALARQMARMALFQISIVLAFQFPYGVATAYLVGTTNLVKSPDHQFQDKLVQIFFNVYTYGLYASSFFCYYAASNRFRLEVVNTIKRLIQKRQRNQILPII